MNSHRIGKRDPAGDLSRRRFIGTSAAATAGFMLLPGCASRNRSNFGGVQIGRIGRGCGGGRDGDADALRRQEPSRTAAALG